MFTYLHLFKNNQYILSSIKRRLYVSNDEINNDFDWPYCLNPLIYSFDVALALDLTRRFCPSRPDVFNPSTMAPMTSGHSLPTLCRLDATGQCHCSNRARPRIFFRYINHRPSHISTHFVNLSMTFARWISYIFVELHTGIYVTFDSWMLTTCPRL